MSRMISEASAKSAVPAEAGPGQIQFVQALRALAALAVVVFHSTLLWNDKAPWARVAPWENGNAGVDLFFVISGFIMVLSSRSLVETPRGWLRFLTLRLIRVVPLYWIATATKYADILAAPGMALHTKPTPWTTAASFLFIPSRNAEGLIEPLLPVGWTLSFEMLFYGVFTLALLLMLDPVMLVAPVMVLLAVISGAIPTGGPAILSLTSPLVLEFVLGMLAARVVLSGVLASVPAVVAAPVAFLGLLVLGGIPAEGGWGRLEIWGVAATCTVLACVALEPVLARILPRGLVLLGEASYSLYLSHGFVLPVLGLVVWRLHLPTEVARIALVLGCMIASSLAAFVIYRFLELPMTLALRRRILPRRASPPGLDPSCQLVPTP